MARQVHDYFAVAVAIASRFHAPSSPDSIMMSSKNVICWHGRPRYAAM